MTVCWWSDDDLYVKYSMWTTKEDVQWTVREGRSFHVHFNDIKTKLITWEDGWDEDVWRLFVLAGIVETSSLDTFLVSQVVFRVFSFIQFLLSFLGSFSRIQLKCFESWISFLKLQNWLSLITDCARYSSLCVMSLSKQTKRLVKSST